MTTVTIRFDDADALESMNRRLSERFLELNAHPRKNQAEIERLQAASRMLKAYENDYADLRKHEARIEFCAPKEEGAQERYDAFMDALRYAGGDAVTITGD